ncbi:hypothetical protein, partial [Modestobacter versicolor]
EAEIERLVAAATEAADRADAAAERLEARRAELTEDAGGEEDLAAAHAAAVAASADAARVVAELTAAERAAERDRAGWQAR